MQIGSITLFISLKNESNNFILFQTDAVEPKLWQKNFIRTDYHYFNNLLLLVIGSLRISTFLRMANLGD